MHRLISIIALVTLGLGSLSAASSVDVVITLTIANDISIAWSASDGSSQTTADRTWAMGTVSLDTAYLSDTQGSTPLGTTGMYISSATLTATVQDVALSVDLAGIAWNQNTAATGVDEDDFTLEVSDDNKSTYQETASGITDLINNLAAGATTTNPYIFRLTTPSSITTGAGSAQTITVTFTASADNAD